MQNNIELIVKESQKIWKKVKKMKATKNLSDGEIRLAIAQQHEQFATSYSIVILYMLMGAYSPKAVKDLTEYMIQCLADGTYQAKGHIYCVCRYVAFLENRIGTKFQNKSEMDKYHEAIYEQYQTANKEYMEELQKKYKQYEEDNRKTLLSYVDGLVSSYNNLK